MSRSISSGVGYGFTVTGNLEEFTEMMYELGYSFHITWINPDDHILVAVNIYSYDVVDNYYTADSHQLVNTPTAKEIQSLEDFRNKIGISDALGWHFYGFSE